MRLEDIDRVFEIAQTLDEAPGWPRDLYVRALFPGAVPERIALAAENSEFQLVGFLVAVLIPPQAELETIAVAKEAQKQGIATRLFTEMLAILSRRQISDVMLEVRQTNDAARSFYRSVGFFETGRRPGYYSDPKEDAILLQRSVVSPRTAPAEGGRTL